MTDELTAGMQEIKALLEEVLPIPGVSGYEEPMIRFCRDRLAATADSVEVDVRGNVYARYDGTAADAPTLMLPAHMDTIGFIVTAIDDNGFLRLGRGGLTLTLSSRRLRVHGSKGSVLGVIGCRVGYGTSPREKLLTAPDEKEMYVDVGCRNPEEVAEAGIGIGASVSFAEPLAMLGTPSRIVSPYLDNRAGVSVMLALASRIKTIEKRGTVVLVGTIEEEMGLRGASTAGARLAPDLAISIDTQACIDTPEYNRTRLPLAIGAGPVIKFSENGRVTNHPRVRQLLIQAAERCGAPHQLAGAPPGGSDMGAVEQSGLGVPSAALGLPRRYAHSPNEVMDLGDIAAAVTILEQAIRILGEGYSLQRI